MDSTSSRDNGRWFEDGDESNADMVSASCFQNRSYTLESVDAHCTGSACCIVMNYNTDNVVVSKVFLNGVAISVLFRTHT